MLVARTWLVVVLSSCGDKEATPSDDSTPTDSGGPGVLPPGDDTGPGDQGDSARADTGPQDSGGGTASVDSDSDGFSVAEGDCDDTDPSVHPSAAEVDWDGLDNNCDGVRGHLATALSLGRHHSCALDLAGAAHCWGSDLDGQSTPAVGAFAMLASTEDTTCGLDAMGQVDCWGRTFEEPFVDFNDWVSTWTGSGAGVTLLFWMGPDLCGTTAAHEVICLGPGHPIGFWSGRFAIDGNYAAGQWVFLPPDGALPGGVGMVEGFFDFSCESHSDFRGPDGWSRWAGIASIDGGREHQCTLGVDGTLDCWGCMAGQVARPPAGAFTAYASGDAHACAIGASGVVSCWGDDAFGQASPPAGETFTSIAAGASHTCGVRRDGQVLCWGSNEAGQSMPP